MEKIIQALQEALQFVDCNCSQPCTNTCTRSKITAAIEEASKRPYAQGYNSDGNVLVVLTPSDIQSALEDGDQTISDADARQLAEEWDNKIVNAMLHDWHVTLRDVLQDAAQDMQRFNSKEVM